MKLHVTILSLALTTLTLLMLVNGEPPLLKRPLSFHHHHPLWAANSKSAKQIGLARNQAVAGLPGSNKQRTLVVQIRSDQPVPLVLKGGRSNAQQQQQQQLHLQQQLQQLRHPGVNHLRGVRPVKLQGPIYLKSGIPIGYKQLQRKPLKIKLGNSKLPMINKPATSYDVPFRFEMPTNNIIAYPPLGNNEAQKLPSEPQTNFITEYEHYNDDHFVPIHTIPAPNLSLPENHANHHQQVTYLPPKSQSQSEYSEQSKQSEHPIYHQTLTNQNTDNQYQVTEEYTNDQTIRDPHSGSQKLFAPDPDPSLPAPQLRPATESFNQPSNGKPLPVDVQSNYLVPAQPLVQIIGGQQDTATTPAIYPIQFAQQTQLLQPVVSGAVNAAALKVPLGPIYDPTYLVTQSNQLYTHHQQHQQQQLFQPSAAFVQAGYANADLTQEVATDGQILQAAKDPHHNIHPVLNGAPQFAALIAAPLLSEQSNELQQPQAAALTATSVAPANVGSGGPGGFIVSNYYDNDGSAAAAAAVAEHSQLLQAYAEEEAQRLEIEAEQEKQQQQQHALQQHQQQQQQHLLALQHQQQQHEQQQQELQQQHELQQQQLQQQQLHQQLQQQQQQQQHQHQQQQHHHEQQQQQHQQQQQQQQHHQHQQQQQQHHQHQQQQQSQDAAAAAFQEHQRLVQQQLGGPLRIFVPDDEGAGGARIQKRSDMVKKGTVENANTANESRSNDDDLFQVSSSVEVSNERHKDNNNKSTNGNK